MVGKASGAFGDNQGSDCRHDNQKSYNGFHWRTLALFEGPPC
jgi:hypothetical protein